MTATDCGPASLCSVLAYHGCYVPLSTVRERVGAGRDGSGTASLLDAARDFGLRARAVRLDVTGLPHLPPGTILHWEFRHWVVFERLRGDRVEIVDPEAGRRTVSLEVLRREFTGVALICEPAEHFQRGGRRRRSLRGFLTRVLANRGVLRRIVIASLLIQLFSLATPVLTGLLVDRVIPSADWDLLQVLTLGLVTLVLFRGTTNYIRQHLLIQLQTQLNVELSLGFVEHLVHLPFAFFQTRSAGDLMMRLNSNALIRERLSSGVLSSLLDGALVTLYLSLLFVAAPLLAAAVLGLAALRVGTFLIFRRRQKELTSESLSKEAASRSYQVEMFSGMETLKSLGAERRAVEHWSNLFVDTMNVELTRDRLDALFETLMDLLQAASPLIILGLGAYLVMVGRMSLGEMLAMNAIALGFLLPLSTLITTAVSLQVLESYIERINDVMDHPVEQDPTEIVAPGRVAGRIRLDGVSFGYGAAGPDIIRNVSLDVAPGEHLALVGASGSGKSTLAKLMLGLYLPRRGRILIDEKDLAHLHLSAFRRQLGIVTQQTDLFNGSIRDNIALCDPDASMDRVVAAARRAGIHDDIAEMPMGYHTVVTDRGQSLSGGQRQRIAIARALIHRPAIALFDEATSALDAVTEEHVQRSLEDLRCTRVTVAHRLSTIRSADRIAVVSEGQIVELGTDAELIAKGGAYAELVRAQLAPQTLER